MVLHEFFRWKEAQSAEDTPEDEIPIATERTAQRAAVPA